MMFTAPFRADNLIFVYGEIQSYKTIKYSQELCLRVNLAKNFLTFKQLMTNFHRQRVDDSFQNYLKKKNVQLQKIDEKISSTDGNVQCIGR